LCHQVAARAEAGRGAVGVRADGTKELIALDDGHRESIESWLDLLRGCKRRGMAAPVLVVGDNAPGIWSAV
jgi:putative transposase